MTVVTKLSAAAFALAAAAVFAQPAQAERTKFEFWYGLTGDLEQRVQETCKRFNDSQPDYQAVCVGQGGYPNTVQNAIAAYRAQKQPTVVQVFDAGTLDLMLSGAFVPARKLMADNGYDIKWDDYFGGIANYYATSKGELMSFPFNSSTALFYWNKDAFAKIGRDKAPETWEDVEQASRQLKAAGYDCPFAFNFDPWTNLEQFSAIHNQPIASKNNGYDGLDAELVFNKTKFVDQVTFIKKMYDEGIFVLKAKGGVQDTQDVVDSFSSGACQMIQTSVGDHGTIGKLAKPDMHWDVAKLPVWAGTERKNSLVGGASLWVLAGKSEGEYKGAAAFLNFLAQPSSVEWWSTVTGYIPVTNSGFQAMKAAGFYDKAPYKGREVAIESLTFTPTTPVSRGIRLGGYVQVRKEVQDALQAIIAGKVSVQEGLDQAVERGNAVLRRFEKTYNGKQLL
ncbi:sn-glycerol 3-phosphate transport system substrate-binding protein [Inquilinus ginsengisoli]|uniref:sn-glycerol-3-phosphate-binding periplasmic protein UgpB n=1 Tax=Inquilinus ginsengisoli TaxID=363840 RepID=A0ABU1JQ25_9PROT|nr:extracellular solute-binding protein [Inquilinus ginsengisoli]MDR6290423.1 sn-glycerol 3-phosphate transport system substrate-binding protein [Inquilinus ginsengisoli]